MSGSTHRQRLMWWFCHGAVMAASWIAPRRDRSAWRSGHDRQLWHWCHFLAETDRLTAQHQLAIARHCWGLFPEAFWLRFDRESLLSRWRAVIGSPLALLLTCALGCTALLIVGAVPKVVRQALAPPVPDADHVVIITLDGNTIAGKYSRTRSDTLLDLASVWSGAKKAEGLSPYSWAPANLLLASRDLPVATARVGIEFFATLGLNPLVGRLFSPRDLRDCPSCVVLSYALWEDEFRSDSHIIGRPIDLNGSPRTVIGVLPPAFSVLSPDISVWTLIDPAVPFTNFQRRVGAVAHLRPGATPLALQHELSDLTESAGYVHPSSQLVVTTAKEQVRRRMLNLLWFLLLATACAVLVAALRVAWRGAIRRPAGASARLHWGGFLAAKSLLLLLVAVLTAWTAMRCVSLWVTGWSDAVTGEYAIWLYLPLAIVVLSWSLHEQRSRCRQCLRRLALPVAIGRTGSVLLNWSGVEMVCPAGHGVLYLPTSPENSLDSDRWHKLDESWESLFRAD